MVESAEHAIARAQLHTLAPQRTRLPVDARKTRTTLPKANDLLKAAHVIEHVVVKACTLLADARADPVQCPREPRRHGHADEQMRHHKQHREPRAQEQQGEGVHDCSGQRDHGRRDGVREEDLKQFHVCSDHGDEVALAFAGQLGRGEPAQRREHLPTEQREQTERQIVVHVLFAIPHGTTDQRAHHHERHGPAHGQAPDGPLSRRAQRHDTEHRQEGRGKMPECAEAARQHHERPQIAHLPQQPAHELEGRHRRALCVRTLWLFHIVFHSV